MKKTVLFVLLALFLSSISYAAVPGLMNYEGRVTSQYGTPESGAKSMTFAIYDSLSGGSRIWPSTAAYETQSVTVNEGIFNVLLGESFSIASSVFSADTRYLEISIDGETLAPRTRIVSVGYALKADDSDNLGGNSSSYYAAATNLTTHQNLTSTAHGGLVSSIARSGDLRLTGNVDLVAGSNVTLTQTGQTIEIASSGGGGGGSVTLVNTGTGLTGGPITSTGTLAIDSTVATLNDSQILTNKTISGSSNTITNINASNITTGNLSDTLLSSNVITADAAFQGDLLYYNGTKWARLGAGGSGQFLKTQGSGADPVWSNVGGGGDMNSATYDPANIAQQLVGASATQELTNKTLTTPTIANFTNATHDHSNAIGGGQISHLNLTSVGTKTHADIDNHIDASTGVHGVAGAVVGTSDAQTLTSKRISGASTWEGTKIGETHGGTNQTSWTKGDILYASNTDTLAKLPIGTNGEVMQIDSGVPSWQPVAGTGTVTRIDIGRGLLSSPNPIETTGVLTIDTNVVVTTSDAQTISGAKTFNDQKLILAGATSGSTTLKATATAGTTTITLPAATGTVALTSDIPAAGANTGLSNLASVAINTSLLPGSAAGPDVGSGTLPFKELYVAGTSGTPASNNFKITGASTSGTRVITLPNATDTLATLGQNETITGIKTFNDGKLALAGSGSGSTTLKATAAASGTITLPAATDTLATLSQGETLTNKTLTTPVINGTITGTTVIPAANGGTNQSTYAKGDIVYASVANTLAKLPIGSTGQGLIVRSGIPSWETVASASGTVTGITASDISISDFGVLYDITGLSFAVNNGETWAFDFYLALTSNNSKLVKFQFKTGPTGTLRAVFLGSLLASTVTSCNVTAFNTLTGVSWNNNAIEGWLQVHGTLVATNSSTVQLQFQNVAAEITTIFAGSYFVARRIQ